VIVGQQDPCLTGLHLRLPPLWLHRDDQAHLGAARRRRTECELGADQDGAFSHAPDPSTFHGVRTPLLAAPEPPGARVYMSAATEMGAGPDSHPVPQQTG